MTTLSEVSSVGAPADCGTRSLLGRRVVHVFILSLALGCSESDAASHGVLGNLGGAGGTMTSGGSGGRGPTAGGTSGSAEADHGAVGFGGSSGLTGASGSGGSNEVGTSSAGASGSAGGSAAGGAADAGGSAGTSGSGGSGEGDTETPNFWATSANTVEVFVNGTSLGSSSSAGAVLAVASDLRPGVENVVGIRATRGPAAMPFVQAEMVGDFGRAGTSTQWKAKPASSADEQTGSEWAATGYDDSSWVAAADVNVNPQAAELRDGPARGIWTSSSSDATAIFRMRFYIPADWSAARPYGFGSSVTGGEGGRTLTVATASELAAAVTGNTAKIIQVSGTIDFTGSEGTTSNTCCYVQQCSTGQSEYITDDLGACEGHATFACTYDKAGTTPLSIGSNTTLVGVGSDATIKGKGLRLLNGVSNVIIRNLTIANINPQVVWGGDAIDLSGATNVWIDHNRISLIARQFLVTHNNANAGITFSYNELDGNTPYSATCNGAHYYVYLIAGSGDTLTMQGNWMHNTSGRGPHAGGTDAADVLMHWVNNYPRSAKTPSVSVRLRRSPAVH